MQTNICFEIEDIHVCCPKSELYKTLENISCYNKDKVYMLITLIAIAVKQIKLHLFLNGMFSICLSFSDRFFKKTTSIILSFKIIHVQVPVQCLHLLQRSEGILNFLKAMLIILIKIWIYIKLHKIQISSCIIQEVYFIFGYQ